MRLVVEREGRKRSDWKVQWKVVTGVLGSNPRHLVELQSIWYSKDFSEYVTSSNLLQVI